MEGIKEKVIFITGGNSGLGKATAIEFAKAGAKIAITARREQEGKDTVKELQELGAEAMFIQCDVTQEEQVKNAVQKTVEKFGTIHFAFNNAGLNLEHKPIHEMELENWDTVMDINIKGVFLCMKYQLKEMLKNGGGSIVNMSSLGGILTKWFIPAPYNASKHAVIGLTKNAALYYAKNNIRVNAVCPAVILTPLIEALPQDVQTHLRDIHPVGRYGEAKEVADAVMWLCSDNSKFITGQSIVLDGGLSIC